MTATGLLPGGRQGSRATGGGAPSPRPVAAQLSLSALAAETFTVVDESTGEVLSPEQARVEQFELACLKLWREKRERFGDTPPDDPRPEARALSDRCLAVHRELMAAYLAVEGGA